MKPDSQRIAVTGMGLISPLGLCVEDSFAAAHAGVSGIRRCDERFAGEYGAKIPCRVGGTVVGFDPTKYVDEKFAARYDDFENFAIAAADEAVADAGLRESGIDGDRVGVVIGTAVTGAQTWQKALYQAFVERDAEHIPGHMGIAVSGNMPTGLVALRFGYRGPSIGVVNACASGGTAVSLAADAIRLGRADAMIAGGSEAAIGVFMYATFINAKAINPTDDPVRACKPFSLDRAGLIKGEGCGLMVLERLDAARGRGARVYAILEGEAHTNDAHHVITPKADGEHWARAMRLALADAQVALEDVDYISAHAASTKYGDLAESNAVKTVFGQRAYDIPVSSTKSMHGHSFGATGAIEAILAIAAMNRQAVLPTTNLTIPDPECDLDYVVEPVRHRKTRMLLKNSFGFGGTNTCLVFSVPD